MSSCDDADELETNVHNFSRLSCVQSAVRPRVFVRRGASAPPDHHAEGNENDDESFAARSSVDKKRKSLPPSSVDNRPPNVVTYGKPNGSVIPPAGFRRRHAPPPRLSAAQLHAIAARPFVRPLPPGVPMYGRPGAQSVSRRRRERFVPPLSPTPPPIAAAARAMPASPPPNHFDRSSLLERREAQPFRELTSLADCEPLEPQPGIDDVMAALDLDDDLGRF